MVATSFKLAAILEFINKTGPGVKSAEKDFGGLAKAAKALGAGLTVAGVVAAGKAAYELGVLGAQSLRTKQAFEAISGSAYEATDNLDAMRRATRGAMSEQQMMATANQLLQMGLAGSAAELETITTMATRLGSAMGKEAGPAVEEFSLMLANQSIPRLDTFGISASKVRARMLELQAATPGLSREMAFMTATMEEGEAAMGRLGDAADDELLANERLEASMEDLKTMAGELLAPAMASVAKVLTTATQTVLDAEREIRYLRETMGDSAVEAAQVEDSLSYLNDAMAMLSGEIIVVGQESENTISAMDRLRQQSQAFQEQIEAGMSPMAQYTGGVLAIVGAAGEASGAMGELNTSVKTVATSFGEMEFDDEQLWKMAAASGANLPELEDLAKILGIATDAEIAATLEAYALVEGFGEGTTSAEELATGFDDLAAATRADEAAAVKARIESEKLREEFLDGEKAASGLQEGTTGAANALVDFKYDLIPVNAETSEFGENIDWVNDILHNMAGEYTVIIHYQHTGVPPSAPPGTPMQSGTMFHRGGWALIGHGGPELVALPRGSRVWPASAPETRAAVNNRYNYGGDTYIINDRLAMALALEQKRHRRIQRIERM